MTAHLSKNRLNNIAMVLIVFIPAILIITALINSWWLPILLVPLVLLGFQQASKDRWRLALVGLLLATIIAFSIETIQIMRANLGNPPEWDFQVFWLDGRTAAQGLNFYIPDAYREVAQGLDLSDAFREEIIDVGFKYPPPTMLMLVPLGWFSLPTAFLLWYIVQSLVFVLDIVLLWKCFLKQSGFTGLMYAAALMLLLRATLSTFAFAQTMFIVLFMLLLVWRDREKPRAGIWLALGIFVKPVLAGLLLWFLLRRKWRVLGSTIAAIVTISLLAVLVFGSTIFFSFFTQNPNASAPDFLYTELINQSLLATILRLTHYDFSNMSPLTHPLFIGAVFVLTAITGWLIYQLNSRHSEWTFALTLSLALLIYPGTLEFYSLVLIVPIFILWTQREIIIGGVWAVAAFITLEYLIMGYSDGHYVFVAIALSWLVLAAIGFWTLTRRQGEQPVALPVS